MSLFLSTNSLLHMHKYGAFMLFLLLTHTAQAQDPKKQVDSSAIEEQDSIKRSNFFKHIGNGFFPTNYFEVDLRYLIKYNQYEGIRTGLGGQTNERLSDRYRMSGYVVYGFKDHHFKYSIEGGFRVSKENNTWINASYTDDLQETGSSVFLTDKRFFSFFEPRLLNIDLFHHHITRSLSIEHHITPFLLSETQFSRSNNTTTYDYTFFVNDEAYKEFRLSTAEIALQWNPFNTFEMKDDLPVETEGYPNFTLQVTKSFKDIFNSDFNFLKADFRTIYKTSLWGNSTTEATLRGGFATGQTPLTHLYHAYPNNITKQTILQRFSVAGINSFETMYFNEFFSDQYATLQIKHFFEPFKISKHYRPQLVLISRMAIGTMHHGARHQNIDFGTLDNGYTEAGLEINKLLFGFGLSFAYRYGAYHLPNFEDNIAIKFTFNISL